MAHDTLINYMSCQRINCYDTCMQVTVHIEPITANDLDEIIDLGEALQIAEQQYEPLLIFNRKESRSHYEKELSNPDALIIAAKLDDGTIVGYQYSYVHTLDYLSSKNRECVLEALYVNPSFRGQGIGRQLTDYAQDWAISTKAVNRLSTHIYSDNVASVELHAKKGFNPYNTELVKHV
jgi:ribosomal protein S18 acetylase RimI-like enzyme